MRRASSAKWVLLGSLYFSQGLPFGFFSEALPVLLRKQHVSLPKISLTGLLALPWALKFLWAPMVDRFRHSRLGARRGWIIPLQCLVIATMGIVGLLSPESQMHLILGAVVWTNLLAATQDISTDALAVEMLEVEERGPANGLQVAGARLGMVVGGGVLLVLYDQMGWSHCFGVMALLLVVAAIPIAVYREPPQPEIPPSAKGLGRWTASVPLPWLLVLATFKMAEALTAAMAKPMWVDLDLGLTQIGIIDAVGSCASLAGALVGGVLVGRLGRGRALLLFAILQTAAVFSFVLVALRIGGAQMRYAVIVGEHFCASMATASLFTKMMDHCRAGYEGTDYTMQASVVVISTGVAGLSAGLLANQVGYPAHFAIAGCVGILSLFFISNALLRERP